LPWRSTWPVGMKSSGADLPDLAVMAIAS